jgi:hypothetical protein
MMSIGRSSPVARAAAMTMIALLLLQLMSVATSQIVCPTQEITTVEEYVRINEEGHHMIRDQS